MSKLKRIRTRINKENLEKAQKEGHITEEQAQEVIDTNGLYNPYTDTYINPNILPEISVTAKAPERTWTSEWTYNDPEFRLAREHRNIAAQEVAKSTRDKMNQVGNTIGKTIIGGTSFTPLWFAAPIAKAGIAASEGDYSGAAKEAAIGLLAPYAIGKGLQKGYSAYQAYRGWQNGLKEVVAEGFQNAMTPVRTNKYGTVKYYGPTMGKTTAVKTNPRLVDFDDIVREEIQQLANKKGIPVRELKTKSDIEYAQLLENAVSKWQANPANKDKTLLISNSVLSNKPIFDNTPVIPSKNQFIARQVARGESDPTYAAQYYDDLLKRNPQLKTDDRFVSEIESGTRSAKISKSELAGIPKGGHAPYTREENIAFRNQINEFANKYGYEPIGEDVTDPEVLERYARSMISKHNSFYRGVHMPYNEDDIAIIHKVLGASPTEEQVLQYVATHPRSNQDPMFISPRSNAGIYGGNGKTAIISRPYKLGLDRTKWFTEGDYPIYQAPGLKQYQLPENAIADPWTTPSFPEKRHSVEGGYRYYDFDPTDKEFYDLVKHLYEVRPFDAPNELTTRSPMIFRGWANDELLDLSRNYGRHPWQEIVFRKQGGKLNYLNYIK